MDVERQTTGELQRQDEDEVKHEEREEQVKPRDGNKTKSLPMRERAVARADDIARSKVESAVFQKLKELNISTDRFKKAQKVFTKIAKDYPATIGKAVSKKQRDDDGLNDSTCFVYGEIQFATFALTIEKIRHKYGGLTAPGGTFVDIGSGTGKAVFAAMLMHEFDKVLGIEILEGLHQIALEMNAIWNEMKITAPVSNKTRQTNVELLCADALGIDWSDADIAFVNSTCFDAEMMQFLADKAEAMKPKSFFVSFTRRLPSESWQVLEYERHLMSWGDATVFIHQKKEDRDSPSNNE